MCAQHGHQRKGGPASLAFGVIGCDQLDQRCPGHDLIHLLQKLAFAGSLEAQVQAEVCLFHDKGFSQIWLAAGTNFWDLCRVSLTAPIIEAWAVRETQTRPSAARLAWRCLKAFLEWCTEQQEYAPALASTNPAKTKKAREALGRSGVKQDALLKEQLPAWFDAVRQLHNPVIAAYLQTLLLTGARAGEVLV